MKKLILVTIALFLFSAGYSQIPWLTLGPKVGFNTNKITTDIDGVKEDMKAGFEVGAFVRLGKKIYVQPEVLFKTKNGTLKVDYNDPITQQPVEAKYDVKLSTLDIPGMVGAKLVDAKVFNIRIMTGPVISMITNKDLSTDGGNDDVFDKDDFKDGTWYWGFGAGVDVLMFALDVRYNVGLNDIYDGDVNNENPELRSNLFSVTLGWKIF
jgi:hypothetical protein